MSLAGNEFNTKQVHLARRNEKKLFGATEIIYVL
jgi:hypothetical protein